jgi:hypothetical protein
MYQVRCGDDVQMILFNRDVVSEQGMESLTTGKAILGAIATRHGASRVYAVDVLLLTSPGHIEGAVAITGYRIDRCVGFAGTARVVGGLAEFTVVATHRPGAFAARIEGTFAAGRLKVNTAVATRWAIVKKGIPFRSDACLAAAKAWVFRF